MAIIGLIFFLCLFIPLRKKVQSLEIINTQKFLLYLSIISGFIGPSFFVINLGPFSLFPFRIFLICLWVLFIFYYLFNRGKADLSGIKIKNYLLFLFIWLAYAAISILWAVETSFAIREIVFLFMAVSIIFFTVYFIISIGDLKKFYRIWLIMFSLLIPVGIWEVITGNHLPVSKLFMTTHLKIRFLPSTVFANPNDYATFIVLSIPFIISFIRYSNRIIARVLGSLILFIGLVLLFATFSRANYLALAVAFIFWFIFLLKPLSKFKFLILLCVVIISLLIISPVKLERGIGILNQQIGSLGEKKGSVEVRLNLAKNVSFFLLDSYGFGVGAGNITYIMDKYKVFYTKNISNVHNWWLELLANYGFLFFGSYLIFYFSIMFSLWKIYKRLEHPAQKMICEALLVSLVSFSIASVSSSSIIAFQPMWLLFAFALAFINYARYEKINI